MDTESVPFIFDAGNLALDFVNTRRVRRGRAIDQLSGGYSVPEWLDDAGLAGPAFLRRRGSPPELRRLADEARRLRDAIASAVESFTATAPLSDTSLHALNRVLASSRSRVELRRGPEGLALAEVEDGDGVLTALAPIAAAAAELLTTAAPERVRRCDSDDCVVWFLDTSKNGRRRWCSMARCGNRAKVRRHYQKQRRRAGAG